VVSAASTPMPSPTHCRVLARPAVGGNLQESDCATWCVAVAWFMLDAYTLNVNFP
jgi:hypothetical protein